VVYVGLIVGCAIVLPRLARDRSRAPASRVESLP
jgi:hypothetical protein